VSAMAESFNAAEFLVSRHVASGSGDRTAVVASETLTYADLDERVGVVAAGLRALGLRRDDRVMLVMSDEIPMLTGILGAVLVTPLFNALKVRAWEARGFAVGLAAHGIGTARAFQVNPVAGLFAGLAMALNAVLTALIVPPLLHLLTR